MTQQFLDSGQQDRTVTYLSSKDANDYQGGIQLHIQ